MRTNNVKAKTCLFTGQVDVQHMPFTYVTYNPDSRDNNLCDKRILAIQLAITNLATYNTKNKPKKCFVQYLNCSCRLGRLKRQQTSDKLRFVHNKTKWRVAPKRKTGAAGKHLLVGTLSRVIKVYQEMYQNSHVMPCIAI